MPHRITSPLSGFTLLEIMVVIALISLVSVSVMLTLPEKNSAPHYSRQPAVFAAILRKLGQQALLQQRWYGLYFADRSYRPVIYVDGKWIPQPETRLKKIPDNIPFALLIDQQMVLDNGETTLTDEQQESNFSAQITISPQGLYNNFELRFGDRQDISLSDPYAQF